MVKMPQDSGIAIWSIFGAKFIIYLFISPLYIVFSCFSFSRAFWIIIAFQIEISSSDRAQLFVLYMVEHEERIGCEITKEEEEKNTHYKQINENWKQIDAKCNYTLLIYIKNIDNSRKWSKWWRKNEENSETKRWNAGNSFVFFRNLYIKFNEKTKNKKRRRKWV